MLGLLGGCGFFGPQAPPWHGDPAYRDVDDAEYVLDQVTSFRRQHGRDAHRPFQVVQVRLDAAKEKVAAGGPPEWAIDHAPSGSADEGDRDVRFWILYTDELDGFDIPSDLAIPAHLFLATAVFRQRQGEHPRYLVVLATPSLNEYRVDIP